MDELLSLKCPKCGQTEPNKKYIKDGAFICAHKNDEGFICGTVVGVYCKSCKEIYPADRFGFRNDAYECKECGKLQWGFTEYKKDRSILERSIQAATQKNINAAKFFDEIINNKR